MKKQCYNKATLGLCLILLGLFGTARRAFGGQLLVNLLKHYADKNKSVLKLLLAVFAPVFRLNEFPKIVGGLHRIFSSRLLDIFHEYISITFFSH